MKQYLEILEQLTEEESIVKQPQTVRITVASKEDAIEKLDVYEPAFIGLNYIKRYHICKHEEGQPCEIEVLS
jgi:hypothetical protein